MAIDIVSMTLVLLAVSGPPMLSTSTWAASTLSGPSSSSSPLSTRGGKGQGASELIPRLTIGRKHQRSYGPGREPIGLQSPRTKAPTGGVDGRAVGRIGSVCFVVTYMGCANLKSGRGD